MFSFHSWEGNTLYWRFSTNFAYLFPPIPYFHFYFPCKMYSWGSIFGPLINVFRQTSHINFLLSLIFIYSFFDILRIFIYSNPFFSFFFGPLINVFLRVFLTFFDKLRIFISSNPLFSFFFWPLINVYRQTSHINFLLSLIFILIGPL